MDKSERPHFGAWWLPFLSAIAIASTPVIVAVITSNATRESTDKDYVGLAVSILSSEKSTKPSRRWAAKLLSDLSPTEIPLELANGLVTGQDVLTVVPLPCLNQLRSGTMLNPTPAAPLPTGDNIKDWVIFSVQQSAQLAKANNDKETAKKVVEICTRAFETLPPK